MMAGFPDFTVKRADEDPRPGLIDAQVINDLLTAALVVADLSFLNPNVFYEIGIRHMAQKAIVHMQRASEAIPFDLSLYRAIKFSLTRHRELENAKEELEKAVSATMESRYEVENPVTRTRGKVQLLEHATSETRVLAGELEAIRERLVTLERIAGRTFNLPSMSPVITEEMVTLARAFADARKQEGPSANLTSLRVDLFPSKNPTSVTLRSDSTEQNPLDPKR